jgi:hypothetical protein
MTTSRRMTTSRIALAPTTSNTLLTYVFFLEPDPLQVSAAAILTLVVSNSSRQAITCSSIQVMLPVGTNAKDLIVSGAQIETKVPDGWSASSDGGVITLTPSGDAGKIEGAGITFVIVTATNGEPGTAPVSIAEMASSPSQPSQPRTATFAMAKAPAQFRLSELIVTAPQDHDVPEGGTATLMWTGQGAGVTYTMSYPPADSGPPVNDNVGSTGPYTSRPLTRTGSVTFTLTASVTVPGQDQPLIVQRQQTVSIIEALSLDVDVVPAVVGVNGLVRLRWNAQNADYCLLDDKTQVPASGMRYFILRKLRIFKVTAVANSKVKTVQRAADVDAAIKPTVGGYSAQGDPGRSGLAGRICDGSSGSGCTPTAGESGWTGGPAVLRGQWPALANTRAAPVIPVVVTGGRGGDGGPGGWREGSGGTKTDVQASGYGGSGGNATLGVTLDGPGEPTQYIIQISAGQPGDGGGGTAGTASATIDGVPVTLPD